MPPQNPPQGPRKYCAIAPHLLKEQNRSIRDPQLLRFAQLINSEMRLGCTVCLACYQNLMKLYSVKMVNARRHQKERETSMSDLSSSQRMSSSDPSVPNPSSRESSTSNDDRPNTSAANARRHQKEREISMSDVSSSQRMSSSDPSVPNPGGVTMRRKQPSASPSSRESSTSNDDRPNTSAPAAAKRNRTGGDSPPPAPSSNASYVSDDDDANSNLSLNAVNGTRLPHIQPIPKRRQFVHLNTTAMEIYMAGITGG